ncbi:hypothetical protein [Streptomyces sp. NPDC007991]|uniref:hypothetical protein n=1 Tax=Streptomyces sp. NPDC007991 TaxID=3364803 RepID=UPI0036ECD58A
MDRRVGRSQAGSNCRDDCAFELCPYPPKGTDGQRVELGEAFPFRRPKAAWQRRTDLRELRGFWEAMGHRAQHNSKVR